MFEPRRFIAHSRSDPRHAWCAVPDATSFQDAALRFAELWASADADEIAVIVTECSSGQQQCFSIDLSSDETRPCE